MRVGRPSFRGGISLVIRVSAEEEMVGTDAGTIVAVVTNEKAIGDWPVCEFPSDPMGELGGELTVPYWITVT